jgi:signal transduction histidine kinase
MAISLSVLGLLAAAFALVMAAAQRQRRLSRQQMEFVAAVSHELRTPLAVICSAGENLADGVVADPAQVKTYGSLIEAEGRRLGDMVERVLRFAGISSGQQTQVRAAVDLSQVTADAVHGVAGEARERGVVVTINPHAPLPATMGDADALRSATRAPIWRAPRWRSCSPRRRRCHSSSAPAARPNPTRARPTSSMRRAPATSRRAFCSIRKPIAR